MKITLDKINFIVEEYKRGRSLRFLYRETGYSINFLKRYLTKLGISIIPKKTIPESVKNEAIARYLNGESSTALAKELDISQGYILKIIKKLNLSSRNKREAAKLKSKKYIENFQNDILKFYYNGSSVSAIAKKISIQPSAIRRFLLNQGIKPERRPANKRQYSVNDTFFDTLETEESLYGLGIWYADGWVSKEKNIVSISLQEKDIDILEKLQTLIQPNKPLYFRDLSKKKIQNQYKLEIHSRLIRESLIKWGCGPNKTHLLKFPKFLDRIRLRHLIRGHFDGDGSICKRKVQIVGTPDFIYGLRDLLEKELNIYCRISKISGTNVTIALEISGKTKAKYFLWWLYRDATIYMQRKYNQYQAMMNETFKQPKRLIFENNKLQKMIDDFLERERSLL